MKDLGQSVQEGGSPLQNEATASIVLDPSLDAIKRRDQILKLPVQLFSPYRLLIMAALWREGELDFTSLQEDIKVVSAGNLAAHLKILEGLKIIDVNKEFVNRRPRTSYKLNDKGRALFLDLVNSLRDSLGDIVQYTNLK
ncbi:MAG: transcriptional regulator [Nitrososphaerales archaeon]